MEKPLLSDRFLVVWHLAKILVKRGLFLPHDKKKGSFIQDNFVG